jgi:hypothetical protein
MKTSKLQQDLLRLIHRNARTSGSYVSASILSVMYQNDLHDFEGFEELCKAAVDNDADEMEKLIEKLISVWKNLISVWKN